MSKLVMFAGGIGTQTGTGLPPIIIDKTLWDYMLANGYGASDLMDTNGLEFVSYTSTTITYGAGDTTYIDGDFSDLAMVVALGQGSVYIYVSGMTQETNNTKSGYFPVQSITGTSKVTIGNTNLYGETLDVFTTDICNVFAGGAANKAGDNNILENCDAFIGNDIDVDTYSIDVLYNKKDETLSTNASMAANSSLLHQIQFIGTKYDATVADNNFIEFTNLADKADFPEIDCASYYFKIGNDDGTGLWTRYRHIAFTGTSTSYVVLAFNANETVFYQCSFINTNTAATAGRVVYCSRGVLLNCYIKSMGTQDEDAVKLVAFSFMNSCFIYSDAGKGVYSNLTERCRCSNNIIVGGANSTDGIYLYGGNTMYASAAFYNNIIYGFNKGINIATLPDWTDNYSLAIYNNIIWGDNSAGSYGIYNADVATKTCTIFVDNNFIGNVDTESNFGENKVGTISLTTIPFINTTPSEAKDFYLNNNTGGGDLIRDKMIPMDYDLDGKQDNYTNGVIISNNDKDTKIRRYRYDYN